MKQLLFVLALLWNFTCEAQFNPHTVNKFEDLLKIELVKTNNVSDKDFNSGKYILEQVQNIIKEGRKLNVTDYWNATVAFLKLKMEKSTIEYFFKTAIQMDLITVCAYSEYMINTAPDTYEKFLTQIPEVFNSFNQKCDQQKISKTESQYDIDKYCNSNNLDCELIRLVQEITETDQKYRFDKEVDWSKQTPLDLKNQELIRTLFEKYNGYVGISLVGEKFQHVMWSVIQHSNLEMMEEFLPIIHDATKNKEISKDTMLKMLIDRIHTIKYNHQIFGSQIGVSNADEQTRKIVLEKYSLN